MPPHKINPNRNIDHLVEKTVSQSMIHKGPVVNTRVDVAKLPDDTEAKREVIEHPGGVVILPYCAKTNTLILIEQWRYPLDRTLLEVPAGKLDWVDGVMEDPLDAAKRELFEETGYTAECWEPMQYIFTSPGFCDEKLYLYKATELVHTDPDQKGLDDEFIDLYQITPQEAFQLVRDGHIVDAKTICLLFHVFGPKASQAIKN